MYSGSVESIWGHGKEMPLPCLTILDISSSRQTCIAKVWSPLRPNSIAIDSTQLAADEMSKMVPVKTRYQPFCGDLRGDDGISGTKDRNDSSGIVSYRDYGVHAASS